MNELHQVVVTSFGPSGSSSFLWDNGVMTPLPVGAGFINDQGQVAGVTVKNGVNGVFLWQGGFMKFLGNIGSPAISPRGFTEGGTVVGTGGINPEGDEHAFVSYKGTLIDLDLAGDPPTGSIFSEGRAATTLGLVVGSAHTGGGPSRAILWSVSK